MPLKVNVGLSRKVGESNYGSRGASVNVELELDSSLIGEPAKFHERIRQVYSLARTSINEELNAHGPPANGNGAPPAGTNGNGTHANGNGAGGTTNGSNGNGQKRAATQSQCKAIHAIANNHRIDLALYLNQHHHVNRPEDLDIKSASQVIDALKGQEGRAG